MKSCSLIDNQIDVIALDTLDPYFNLACEEHLVRHAARPIFMLWRNGPCVVLGRGQNAYAEVDEKYIKDNDIIVARRISGGGAVFHDEGNVNFTFIFPKESEDIDFARFVSPICDAISTLGHKAELSGRNDIMIDGYKVSGNAQCHLDGRVMHHGCILWSADLSKLAGALNPDPTKLSSKGIKSVRSRVANIKDITGSDMSSADFMAFLFDKVVPNGTPRDLTQHEKAAITQLRNEKFATREWVWGKEHKYQFSATKRFAYGKVAFDFNIAEDKISDMRISGDFFGADDVAELEKALIGINPTETDLQIALSNVAKYIHGSNVDELIQMIIDTIKETK